MKGEPTSAPNPTSHRRLVCVAGNWSGFRGARYNPSGRHIAYALSDVPKILRSLRLEDIVGLYMRPPKHAIVLSVDEKSHIQALDGRPVRSAAEAGKGRQHDPCLEGPSTSTLFAALNALERTVTALHAAPPIIKSSSVSGMPSSARGRPAR